MSLSSITVPVLFLLLFAGAFGHALRTGLAGVPSAGGYIDYLVPGIILMTACSTAETTAVSVSTDMTEGIIARFRSMAITRTSVFTGQVVGGLVRSMIPIGNDATLAVAWCAAISVVGYIWAPGLYNRNRAE